MITWENIQAMVGYAKNYSLYEGNKKLALMETSCNPDLSALNSLQDTITALEMQMDAQVLDDDTITLYKCLKKTINGYAQAFVADPAVYFPYMPLQPLEGNDFIRNRKNTVQDADFNINGTGKMYNMESDKGSVQEAPIAAKDIVRLEDMVYLDKSEHITPVDGAMSVIIPGINGKNVLEIRRGNSFFFYPTSQAPTDTTVQIDFANEEVFFNSELSSAEKVFAIWQSVGGGGGTYPARSVTVANYGEMLTAATGPFRKDIFVEEDFENNGGDPSLYIYNPSFTHPIGLTVTDFNI